MVEEEGWLPIYRSKDGTNLYEVSTTSEELRVDNDVLNLVENRKFNHPAWKMLVALARNPGRCVTYSELWKEMYGGDYIGDPTGLIKQSKKELCGVLKDVCPIGVEESWTTILSAVVRRGYKLNLMPDPGDGGGLPTGGGVHLRREGETFGAATPSLALNVRMIQECNEGVSALGRRLNSSTIKIDPCEYETIGFGHNFKADGGLTWFGQGTKSHRLVIPGDNGGISAAFGVTDLPAQRRDESVPNEQATSPVSRYHCVLVYRWREQSWRLFDLDSANGTMVVRKEPEGAESILIAGLGRKNKGSLCVASAASSPLEAVAVQTGAKICDNNGSYFTNGVPIKVGDRICMAFRVDKDEQGACRLIPRNESCVIEIVPISLRP